MKTAAFPEHGGDLDRARALFGGADWMDLSTGINPQPYPLPDFKASDWARLPGLADIAAMEDAARGFWGVPDGCEVVAAGGASALIAALPHVMPGASVHIPGPTYNEYARAFEAAGWPGGDDLLVAVHPNNPDGRVWDSASLTGHAGLVIDESFGDVGASTHIDLAAHQGTVVLKSFGKFWGLAGVRLGFAICLPDLAMALRARLGPWPVSGPALAAGTAALHDRAWAEAARARLCADAARLDGIMERAGLKVVGGTDLFRLVECDAAAVQAHLGAHHIWTRVFSYAPHWLRIGLPGGNWARLEVAFGALK